MNNIFLILKFKYQINICTIFINKLKLINFLKLIEYLFYIFFDVEILSYIITY